MHPIDRPTRAEFEREADGAARRSAGIAPASVDIVIAGGERSGIAARLPE